MLLQDLPNQSAESNATTALYTLLRGIKAKVTQITVQDMLPRHPNFPSLLSLSEMLTSWGIENSAFQLNDVKQLHELPIPFVAHLNRRNGWYVVVTDINNYTVTYSDSIDGIQHTPVNKFTTEWSGIVLVAETNEDSGEEEYTINFRKETLGKLKAPTLWIGSLLIVIFSLLTVWKNLFYLDWILIPTHLTGLILSSLLVTKQLGLRNNLIDRLCQVNNETSCDEILNSPASKLWGWLSWADVGLIYFIGNILLLVMSINHPTITPLISALSLIVLPYIIYSIYYQFFIIKSWCPLCLGIQFVLLTEGIIAFQRLQSLPNMWQPYFLATIALLLPIIAWIPLKSLLASVPKSRREHDELIKLKRNSDLFQALLSLQPVMLSLPNDIYTILLGNPDAQHILTFVTNPFCGPCAFAHKEIKQLIRNNSDIKVQVIFTCDGPDGQITQLVAHILALIESQQAVEALSDWYNQKKKDYSEWAKKYPIELNHIDWITQTERHRNWCEAANINATPTFFVNNRLLPNYYNLEDLRWLINKREFI